MYKFAKNFIVIISIAIFAAFTWTSAIHESLTFDEYVYMQEGRNNLLLHTFALDPFNPPLAREIELLPYVFSRRFQKDVTIALKNPLYGRITSILAGVILLTAVYLFSKQYFGRNVAVLSTFFLALEPTFLANSHYVTIDVWISLIFFLSFWQLLRYLKQKTYKNALLLGVAMGLGVATKITFIPYFVCTATLMCMYTLLSKKKKHIQISWLKLIAMMLVVVTVVWSTYFFSWQVVIRQRQDSSRISAKVLQFAQMQHSTLLTNTILFFEQRPLPLGDFFATLKNNAFRSGKNSQCFFLGSFYQCQWYFMPVNLFLKLPLPLIIFFGIGVFCVIKQKKKENVFILGSPLLSVFAVSMIFRLEPLVRYVLPMYPFLIIIAATSFPFWAKQNGRKIILALLIVWYAVSSLSSFPHFISYANELTLGKKQLLLTDSNMDWGQSLPDIEKFISKNNIGKVELSYFGRDNGDWYGLKSNKPYTSYKNNEICEFHTIQHMKNTRQVTLISSTNWYACGYNKNPKFSQAKIKGVVGESILVF